MSIAEKSVEIKDSSMSLKRAPSAGTVTLTTDSLMWERSQSDANLTLHKENKANGPKVSDNARVYWDLSCADKTEGSKNQSIIENVIACGMVNTTGIGGFQISLETIHQHDELFEIDSSNESLTSSSYVETSSSYQKLENQFHHRPNSHTLNSGISSMEQLPNYSHNKRHLSEVEIRKSCSELSTSFKLKPTAVVSVNEITEPDQTKYSNSNCLVFENEIGFPKDSLLRKPPLPFETQSSNYFCESDFDDSREQIPNYQVKIKLLQDEFFDLIQQLNLQKYPEFEWPSEDTINNKIQILSRCNQILRQAWMMPNIGRDYATSLCDLIRQEGLLNFLTQCMTHAGQVAYVSDRGCDSDTSFLLTKRLFVLTGAELFSQILTCENLDSILGLSSGSSTPKTENSSDFLNLENLSKSAKIFKEVVKQSWLVRTDVPLNREFIAILEAMLKHHEKTNRLVVQSGGLKSLIFSCRSTDNLTLRHVAFAMVNLGLFGDFDIHVTMAQHKVADWLFPLAFHSDDIIKYYACLAIVVLSSHKELAQIVYSSGTIELVFSFIKTHSPYQFAEIEPSHLQGRSSKWLQRLLPILKSDSIEAVSLSSFHFVMEARIKQRQGKTQIFNEIGAIEVLQKVASTTYRLAAQFARQALKILGEPIPYCIFHPVPIWNVEDVCHWLNQIDFSDLAKTFEELRIDGDILLTINEDMLKDDLGIKNGIVRLRLLREISKLKGLTTYETCDPTSVYEWLKLRVGANYCQYTYSLIKAGVDRKFLPNISDDMLACDCSISNSVHRTRILNAIEDCKLQFHKDTKSMEQLVTKSPEFTYKRQPSVPKQDSLDRVNAMMCEQCVISNHADDTLIKDEKVIKNIDVFISYRRNNGSQLASLLMVHLRLRGYRVFLDIERLPAGKFNENLLQSIQRARNFIIVLTPNSLDRCIGDVEKKDWIHREIVCALQSDCNVIPVTDKFEFPPDDSLPADMRSILHYNAVSWVHDYQDACVEKIEQFMQSHDCKCPFSPPQTRMSPVIKPLSYLTNFQEDMLNF